MVLSVDEQALAARLGLPEHILAIAKEDADQPLQGVMFTYERDDEAGHVQTRQTPLLCVTCDHMAIETQVRYIQHQLRRSGYLAFILAKFDFELTRLLHTHTKGATLTLQGENRSLIGIFPGQDRYELLRMRYTRLYSVGTDTLITTLRNWEQRCQFDILGAGYKWLTLYFQTLPRDLVALAREACELDSGFFSQYSDELRAEGSLTDETDEETEDALTAERLALDIQAKRRLYLSYY